MNTQNLTINGLSDSICYYEAQGLGLCFSAYADNSAGEYILEIGFNPNSGYVYIALENGISICCAFGRGVEYLVSDYTNGEEHFFDSYHEAETFEPFEEEAE
jgi:hypothetical protein